MRVLNLLLKDEILVLNDFCDAILSGSPYSTSAAYLKRLSNVGAIRGSGFNKFVPTEFGLALLKDLVDCDELGSLALRKD